MEYILNIIKENWSLYTGYAFFASIAVVVDLGTLYALTEYVGIWYFYSAAISFVFGVTTNFTLNKVFNFKNRSSRVVAQFSMFVFISIIGLSLNQIILYTMVEFFDFWYLTAKLTALVFIANFSFYCHKNFTFQLLK